MRRNSKRLKGITRHSFTFNYSVSTTFSIDSAHCRTFRPQKRRKLVVSIEIGFRRDL